MGHSLEFLQSLEHYSRRRSSASSFSFQMSSGSGITVITLSAWVRGSCDPPPREIR